VNDAARTLHSVPQRTSLQEVANTLANHLERCREEIATGERMLEDLRRHHGIIPDA